MKNKDENQELKTGQQLMTLNAPHPTLNHQPSTLNRPPNSPWSALESVPGLSAIPAVWREKMGEHFESFARAFFQARPETAAFYPCRKCRCPHEVTVYAPDDIVAASP